MSTTKSRKNFDHVKFNFDIFFTFCNKNPDVNDPSDEKSHNNTELYPGLQVTSEKVIKNTTMWLIVTTYVKARE